MQQARAAVPSVPPALLWASSCLLYAALAWASHVTLDPTVNDFERLPSGFLLAGFFVILAGLAGSYLLLVFSPRLPALRTAIAGTLVLAIPLIASYPVGSRDIFAYAFFGKMLVVHGVDPYVTPPSALASDPWYPLLQAWWKDATIVYGPPFAWQTRLYHWIAAGDLQRVLWAHKLGNLLLLPLSAWLVRSIGRTVAPGDPRGRDAADRAAVLWIWNPLVLFESLGSGHNDLAMTSLILAAVLLTLREGWSAGIAVLTLSFWYKWYSAVLVPIWMLWALRRWGWSNGIRKWALGAAYAIAISIVMLVPLAGSLAEAVRNAAAHPVARLLFPTELPPTLWALFQVIDRAGGFASSWGRPVFDVTRLTIFAAGLGLIALRRRSSPYDGRCFVEDLTWCYLLFAGFLATILYPWHLLGASALALATADEWFGALAAGIAVVALLSYFLTFTVSLLGCALCLAAVSLLRRRGAFARA